MTRPALSLTLAVLATLWGASGAAANTPRYVSPSGSGTACTSGAPCDLYNAVGGSLANPTANGDEVIIAPGDYGSPVPLTTDVDDLGRNLDIHGQVGAPRPVITSSAGNGFFLHGDSTLSHVEVDYLGGVNGVLVFAPGSAHDLVVNASGDGSLACSVFGTLSDSLCLSTGTAGSAVEYTFSAGGPVVVEPVLRGVTAEATGLGGTGILVQAGLNTDLNLTATNVIAHGTLNDVRAQSVSPTGNARAFLDHSDYATTSTTAMQAEVTPAGSGTNKLGAPLFANAATGNYHVLAGSPTIDTGAADPPGATDLDGRPRTLGPAPDMGAYELPKAPTVGAVAAAGIAPTGVNLSAPVNPQGLAASVVFVYTDPDGIAVNSQTVSAGGGRSPVTVQASVGGLRPRTNYTVRAVATNSAGSTTSTALVFITATPAFTGVVIRTTSVRVRQKKAAISLACPAGILGPCRVSLTLKASGSLGTAGKGKVNIRAGARRTLKVRISAKVRARLTHGRHLRVKATASATDGVGQHKKTSRKVKLRG